MLVEVVVPAVLVLLVDQASKRAIASRLAPGQVMATLPGIAARLRRVDNRRSTPGVLAGPRRLALVWLAVVAGAGLAALALDPPGRVALGIAIGGAAGNVLDRLRHGGVVDFIDLRIWPVFNLADLAIVAGVALAAWSRW
jgi:signal peptidase II